MVNATLARRLTQAAHSAAAFRGAARENSELGRAVRLVKVWQRYRLSRTHSDLLAHPRYNAAALFFVDDLYGSGDHAQRDSELARVIPTLNRFLPEPALVTLADAVELDALSESLDHRVAEQLLEVERAYGRRFVEARFEAQAYAQAYHGAGGFRERDQQMKDVREIGESLDRLVRKPLLYGLLNTMGPAARAAGVGRIHEFLLRGFSAFRAMDGAKQFLATVLERERALADALERGDATALPT